MATDLGAQMKKMLAQEMGKKGEALFRKHCKNLGMNPKDLKPQDIPIITRSLSESLRSLIEPKKAQDLVAQLLKLAKLESISQEEMELDSRAIMLMSTGEAYMSSNNWARAREMFFQALGIPELQSNPSFKSRVICKVAQSYREQGDVDKALLNYEKGLEMARIADEKYTMAECLAGIGYLQARSGDKVLSQRNLADALRLALETGDVGLIGSTMIDLGLFYAECGELTKAQEHYRSAIEELKEIDDHSQLARAYNNMGDVYLRMEKWSDAIKEFELTYDEAKHNDNDLMLSWASFNIAQAFIMTNDLGKAKKKLDESLSIAERLGDKIGVACIYGNYGRYYAKRKEWAYAESYFNRSLQMCKELDYHSGIADISMELGAMMLAKGDRGRADAALDEAMRLYSERGVLNKVEEIKALRKE